MENDPNDINTILQLMISEDCSVVYGSRILNKDNVHSHKSFYWGGRLLSFVANVLYNQNITDEPTCYKMFKTSLLQSIDLECTGFEFCPEVTAKVSKLGHKIKEVPISYNPRTVNEGKKIRWKDGLEAVWVLLKNRF